MWVFTVTLSYRLEVKHSQTFAYHYVQLLLASILRNAFFVNRILILIVFFKQSKLKSGSVQKNTKIFFHHSILLVRYILKLFLGSIFTTSARGKRQVFFGGYKYSLVQKYEGKDVQCWYCSSHHSKGCKATLRTVGDTVLDIKYKAHNHERTIPRNLQILNF